MLESNQLASDQFQTAIQLAGFRYIVCLKVRPTNADHRIKIEKVPFIFNSIKEVEEKILHSGFQRWAGSAVLRDLIESFSIFLYEVYRNVVQINSNRAYSKTPEAFEMLGVEDQLNTFSKDFAIDRRWIDLFVSYNRVRNCLAHRQGIVSSKDCDEDNQLAIRWIKMNIDSVNLNQASLYEDARSMNGLITPKIAEGEAFKIDCVWKHKCFESGSALNFHPKDILEIIGTFQFAATVFASIER